MWLLTSKYVSVDYLYYFMARYSWRKFESSDWLQLGQDFCTIKSIITQIFLCGSQKIPSKAQPAGKKLGLTFAKMAILNSRAIDFLVTLHLMKVSVHGQPVRTI